MAVLLACLGLAPSVAAVGCGQEDEGPREITISQTTEPLHLDPAFAYTGDGLGPVGANELMQLVYTPLLAYRHEEGAPGAELIPGLAKDLPDISDDGETYTLTVREGLEYSNGIEVRASDFEHTVKRVLTAGSPAVRFLDVVEGVDEYLEAGEPGGEIAGIQADDESGEIVIELTEPDASFSHVLAMWFTGLVPGHTQFRDRSASPPPGVGPFVLAESEPGERVVLAKNETFSDLAIPDIPTGNLDEITIEISGSVERQAEGVLGNELDYMRDSPPSEVKSTLLSEDDERYREHPAAATYFFFLDAERPPFDDPRVREAVNYGIDKRALARAFDGEVEPGCAFLAPGTPGYDEDLDVAECPYGDPGEPPDTERARRLIARADATGAKVIASGSDQDGIAEATEAYAEMLDGIGLDAEARIVDHDAYLWRIARGRPIGQTGFASSFPDFPHPLLPYSLIVDGADTPTAGARLGVVDDAAVAEELERLNREQDLGSVAEDWAVLDRYLVTPPQSYVAPFGHPKLTTFFSNRLDLDLAVAHPVYRNDYSTFALVEDDP